MTHALLLLAFAVALRAQQPVITLDTQATTPQLHDWLHSGDPRLIAWAATLTAKEHDKTILAEMPPLLEHWALPAVSYALDQPQREQLRAAEAVLDTLIQENATVPVPMIRAVAATFPSQALVLVARLPLADAAPLLHDWTAPATDAKSGRLLARVASMMLAKEPTEGFINEILNASEEELRITLIFSRNVTGGTSGTLIGDYLGPAPIGGWPEEFAYQLVENDTQNQNLLVVNLDDDRIDARRFPSEGGWGSGRDVAPLNSVTRHRLIAHWLGLRPQDMPWQAVENRYITWTDGSAYRQQLGSFVEAERQKLQTTVETLIQHGLIKQGHPPQLRVTIKCGLDFCPLTPAPTPPSGPQ